MIKIIIGLGVVVAIVVGVYVTRNLSVKPMQVVEQSEVETKTIDKSSAKIIKQGSFSQVDVYHKGTGNAVIYETADGPVLKFENGVTIAAGPDLFVYLSKKSNIEPKLNADIGEFASLGKLKSTTGDQTYALPDNYQDFNSVAIWCRAFGVMFTVANLN